MGTSIGAQWVKSAMSSFTVCPGVADAGIAIIIESQAWKGKSTVSNPLIWEMMGLSPQGGNDVPKVTQ